ncbi:hypothetical protein Hsar01_01439 [Haloferula sargassicola]|uniref:Uncharacterized protein n=1 Tax=Haloferula sargassicola TaxID=490096 RepID=A0ABP9UNF4_9BACT
MCHGKIGTPFGGGIFYEKIDPRAETTAAKMPRPPGVSGESGKGRPLPCKPDSVRPAFAGLGDHFSHRARRRPRGLGAATNTRGFGGRAALPLFCLAPRGVCRATVVTSGAVGSYPTFSPLLRRVGAVCFLLHFPSGRLDATVPLFQGARCPVVSGLSSAGFRKNQQRSPGERRADPRPPPAKFQVPSSSVVRGPWSVVRGPWSLVLGPWSLVRGPGSGVRGYPIHRRSRSPAPFRVFRIFRGSISIFSPGSLFQSPRNLPRPENPLPRGDLFARFIVPITPQAGSQLQCLPRARSPHHRGERSRDADPTPPPNPNPPTSCTHVAAPRLVSHI